MTRFIKVQNSQFLRTCQGDLTSKAARRSLKEPLATKIRRVMFLFLATASLAGLPGTARSQAPSPLEDSPTPSATTAVTAVGQMNLMYVRPTQRIKVNNYVFDAFGPYPIAGAAFAAGINQASNAPPEWNQGVEGYAKRFGSDLGIAAVSTTTRYGLSEAFKQDDLYYRCDCSGVFPRLSHAMISTLTARRGEDGHRVFSVPALVAPYAGSMTAIYGWFPSRYGAKDAFRIGNYGLLSYMGENVALEFFYSGPHSLLRRMHLNNAHGSLDQGPNR